MIPLKDCEMNQINAIRNSAQIAKRRRSQKACNPSRSLRQNQQKQTRIKERQPGITYCGRDDVYGVIQPPKQNKQTRKKATKAALQDNRVILQIRAEHWAAPKNSCQ